MNYQHGCYGDNSLSIGNTPIVKLNRITRGIKANLFAKIEGRNPSFSVKCRIGASMIWDAEERGLLKPGSRIIEPTSGNTGIALAFVCASRGYKLTITMPESMSVERRKVLAVFGTEIILTPANQGMRGAIQKAEELAASGDFFMPQQFKNPANPRIHYRTTGPEIYTQMGGKVDILVAGVGTGGTISGAGRFLKEKNPNLKAIAVEPAESPVITQFRRGEPLTPSPHLIQGIGAGFIPDTLDTNIIDDVICVFGEEALEYGRRLAREEGILCGISSGAAVAAALKVAQREENEGKNIVVILPDSGERYLSSRLFEGLFDEKGLLLR